MTRGIRTITIGLGFATALTSVAMAGGFSRGTADTDILYEEGGAVTRLGAVYVMPQRGYEMIGGAPATDGDYSDAYVVPSLAFKLDVNDDLRCAATMTDAYGGGATYGDQAIAAGRLDGTGTVTKNFTSNEIGATCGFKFDLGKGRAWIIGGVFGENFTYSETVSLADMTYLNGIGSPLEPFGGSSAGENSGTLSFNGQYELGYRVGVAYEIPEIALRAQLMYRSGVKHDPGGSFRFFDTATGDTLLGGAADFSTLGHGRLPQSVELKAQSGIAPGWLAFGSVKWTDWSVVQTLDYTISFPPPTGDRDTNLEYFWKDGWTVSGGVGHAFNDMVSGSLSLTWDQGVSTTEDVFTDTWTLGGGLAIAANSNTKLSVGGAVSYLTSGSVAQQLGADGPGDTFAYSVGNDWSYALGGNLLIKF
ncbi:OmpP1/FadL family transporter [Oricola indica]|uniref:OmpP1/FadL family transporter n=1 Tax=Oricola indica TaxID=2872591 RepID=UPI001CC1B5C5|nr:outer membrane protein transport protein [Oricola indica]